MRRPTRLLLVAVAALMFVVVSAGIARILAANGAERAAILGLLRAEAHGDRGRALAALDGCDAAACRSVLAREVTRLRRPGDVEILRLDPSTDLSLGGGDTGTARVAWKTPTRLPLVQCVRVRRDGGVLSGFAIRLVAVTPPIDGQASCPSRF